MHCLFVKISSSYRFSKCIIDISLTRTSESNFLVKIPFTGGDRDRLFTYNSNLFQCMFVDILRNFEHQANYFRGKTPHSRVITKNSVIIAN